MVSNPKNPREIEILSQVEKTKITGNSSHTLKYSKVIERSYIIAV